jgi:heme/copper-type cytochrome/quinol oxidase subunit 3
MSATSNAVSAERLYPTTGEPVSINASRNNMGIWLCIVSDATGTLALLVAYSYLWSLNVNDGWAPPSDAWADPLPFWIIVLGSLIATVLMWWGVRAIPSHGVRRLTVAAGLASVVVLVTFIIQLVQVSTFPFGPADGAYASATFWLCFAAVYHLFMLLFLVPAILARTRAGRITADNHSHARFVAMFMTWATIAIFLGALFATTMTVSPNDNSPSFGTFQE